MSHTRPASASEWSASPWRCSSIMDCRSSTGRSRCAMSSATSADLLKLDPAAWKPQALHAGERTWVETNCYIDVWAELLPALGHPAEAALAFTVRQDFEGDHFTFFKFPLEDLERLFGLSVQELAIYDSVRSEERRVGKECRS